MHLLSLISILCLVPSAFGASWIVPNTVWYDTDGKKIDAHGGGIIKEGVRYEGVSVVEQSVLSLS